MIRPCVLLIIVLLQSIALPAEPPGVIDIGDRLELIVDRFLIDQMKGTQLKLHAPRAGYSGGLSAAAYALRVAACHHR